MSLVATLVQNFRANAPEYDKFEFRITEAGAFNAFLTQDMSGMSWMTPDLKRTVLGSTPANTVSVPVINYKDVTIRSTRPLTIAADENTSALDVITFSTLAYGFHMYPMQHYNNEIDYQKDFDRKFKAMLVKLAATLDGLAVTALDAAKTQVIGEVVGGHTFASNVVSEAAATLKDSYILADLDPLMRSNDYMPFMMDVVGNQGVNAILQRMEGFGEFNQENKALQFMSKRFGFSNAISNAVGKDATGFAIADGTLGLLTRVEPDSVFRTRLPDGHEWDTFVLPGLGIEVGTYSYISAVDASAVAGAATAHLTRTSMQAFDFAFDIAFPVAYNSAIATIPAPIIKFDVAV